ncbi:MAG: hypothetical protein ACRET8_03885, partial [Burkholderiales bacterium]
MRFYSSLLACFSVVATIVFTACHSPVSVYYPTALTDMATANTPYAGANALPFQPTLDSQATLISNLDTVDIPGVTIAAAGLQSGAPGSLQAFGLVGPVIASFYATYLLGVQTPEGQTDFTHWYFQHPDHQQAFSDSLITWG